MSDEVQALYTQQVQFITHEGQMQREVFITETGQQALKEARLKYPQAVMVGASRLFRSSDGL